MKTYRIPNTDLDASRIAFGTWHLGGAWDFEPPSAEIRERASRLIHTAVDQGINFIDLADIYTRGKSDTLIGDILRQSPGLRDRLILQEKCGIILHDPRSPSAPGRYDFSYQHLIEAVDLCLSRLHTDHVEILLLHRPDPLVEPDEVARAFDELQAKGKVRYFGVSNHSPMQIDLLRKSIRQPLIANQLELNLLHHWLISEGVMVNVMDNTFLASSGTLDYCRAHDIMIQAWSPVGRGVLFDPPADAAPHVKAVAQEIADLAAQHQTTKEAIALAWLLRHPAGVQPILGTMNPQRIIESCRADDVELSRIEWYRLLQMARGKPVP